MIEASRRSVQNNCYVFKLWYIERKKNKSFWHKKLVTCWTKIRPGKVGNWRIFESNWLNIKSQIDSTLRVKLTLNIESLIGSTLRVKLAQHWESNWLNIESQIDSTLRVKLTQHWESNWLKYSPVTHFARSNYNSSSDSTFKVKMTQFFLSVHWEKKLSQFDIKKWGQILVPPVTQFFFFNRCTEREIESFWLEKFGQILVPPVTLLLGWKWLNIFSRCT